MLRNKGESEQIKLYEEMLAIAQKQEKVLQEEDVDEERLTALIDKRQEIIKKLEALGEIIRSDKILQLMTQIKDLDQNNEVMLRQGMDEIRKKMVEVQQNKKANRAYEPEMRAHDGVFVDFSG